MSKKAKVTIGILVPIAVILLTITIFLCVVLQCDILRADIGATDGEYDVVLGDIEGITDANPRIVDIAMLGGHGASSYNVKANAKLGVNDAHSALGKADPFIKGFTFRFSKTQTVDVRTLISQGARYLQIKCSYFEGEWWAEHAKLSVPLKVVIEDVLDYLCEVKGEVLFPMLEPVYLGEGGTLSDLHDYVMSVKKDGKTLMDYVRYGAVNVFNTGGAGVKIGDLRYNDVTLNGKESGVVLIDSPDESMLDTTFIHTGSSQYDKYFFDEDANAFHPWHHRFDSDVLLEKIDAASQTASQDRYKNMLRINQTQGAFNSEPNDFADMLGKWSLIDFAEFHNPRVLDDPRFDKWLNAMPIVLTDYSNCDNKDFNKRINAKIRDYNLKLVQTALNNI